MPHFGGPVNLRDNIGAGTFWSYVIVVLQELQPSCTLKCVVTVAHLSKNHYSSLSIGQKKLIAIKELGWEVRWGKQRWRLARGLHVCDASGMGAMGRILVSGWNEKGGKQKVNVFTFLVYYLIAPLLLTKRKRASTLTSCLLLLKYYCSTLEIHLRCLSCSLSHRESIFEQGLPPEVIHHTSFLPSLFCIKRCPLAHPLTLAPLRPGSTGLRSER